MKLFREFMEERRERIRNIRFGGWSGIVIKILLCLTVLWIHRDFGKESVEVILWFISGGKSN